MVNCVCEKVGNFAAVALCPRVNLLFKGTARNPPRENSAAIPSGTVGFRTTPEMLPYRVGEDSVAWRVLLFFGAAVLYLLRLAKLTRSHRADQKALTA
jgi:hypothetical protein